MDFISDTIKELSKQAALPRAAGNHKSLDSFYSKISFLSSTLIQDSSEISGRGRA